MKSALAFVILILSSLSAPRCGATVYHSDGSAANVQYLHDNSAHNGDTITLPTGAFTWQTGVTISKGITLQGVAGATQINRAGYSGALVSITGLPSDLPVRITGIRFNSSVGQNGELNSISTQGPYGGSWGMTQLRIDHCYFYGGMRTLFFRYRINGVVDHNTFHDCAYITEHYGDDDFAWQRVGTPQFGTSDAIFFEDNMIIADTGIGFFDTLSDQNTGGKLVWRHNTFDVTAYTGVFGSLIGEHGNQAYWQGHDDWLRGGIMHEFYNNTVRFGTAFRIIWFRGGRNIVANNTFIGTITSRLISFDEEEGYGGSGIHPPRTTWPGEDQVNNSFFFGNTLNGNPVNSSLIGTWDSRSDPYIRVNRDYWLQAPSGLTVTTYPQPGYPSLPNYPLPYNPAVTSWTPYIYPHPLVSSTTPTPTPTPSSTATATAIPTATATGTATATATPRPTATATATATPTATPTPTPTPTPTATPTGDISFPATSGIITSPFVINGDSTISQPVETLVPAQGGRALYTFNVTTPGDYVMSAMVNCPDGGSNSFFVNIDAEPSTAMVWHIPVTQGLESRTVTWPPGTEPKVWTLNAGVHQLIVRGREANARLGQITLRVGSPPPTPTPTATSTPTASPTPDQCEVPNFIGARENQAQAIWNDAGFTTEVIILPDNWNNHHINWQSLPEGFIGSCSETTIMVR